MKSLIPVLTSLALSPSVFAAPLPQHDINQQFLNQQQRQKAQEQQVTPVAPEVRLSPEPRSALSASGFPDEKPCFTLSQVALSGTKALPHWLPLQRQANTARGHCLGAKGINLLMGRLQNTLIGHGYVTTRVLAPQQDLNSGVPRLVVMPGYVRQVRLTDDSDKYATLYSAFPAHGGDVLDLRDIEQGLENLQRLPTVQTSMEIVPGEQPGESDIVISRHQERIWRVDASLDDSGSQSTGEYQGNLTLSLDNPLSLSDLFYLSGSHNLDGNGGKNSQSLTGHYSVPFGYWQAGITASHYDYVQTVAGLNGDYQYSGSSKNIDFQLSRILHRSGSQKTTLSADVITREQRNYINDNLSVSAVNNLAAINSDLIAGRDVLLKGKNVSILAAQDESTATHTVEQKTSGLTLALSGAAGSALNTAVTTAKQSQDESNSRIAALQATKAALSGVQAGQAVALDQAQGADPKNDNAIGVTLSYGSQSSKSEQTQTSTTSQGSSVMAGHNLVIQASDGDISVQGSQLQAGNNALLDASRDIILKSGENTSALTGKNESKGGTEGIGIGAGSAAGGFRFPPASTKPVAKKTVMA